MLEMRLMVMSDLHLSKKPWQVRCALRMGADADAVLLVGDLTNDGTLEQMELMHREFSSSYTAKFVIEKERMYVENANRAANDGCITVDNLEPNSKNPVIAAFFRNIGYAEQLGSGVRNLFNIQ